MHLKVLPTHFCISQSTSSTSMYYHFSCYVYKIMLLSCALPNLKYIRLHAVKWSIVHVHVHCTLSVACHKIELLYVTYLHSSTGPTLAYQMYEAKLLQ